MSRIMPPPGYPSDSARQHLDCSSSSLDPSTRQVYRRELDKHNRLYPSDTNFRLQLQPGFGFGIVVCLEEGCKNAQIPLISRIETPDGGKETGLGSLSSYRMHIVNNPAHIESRDARLRECSGASVKVEHRDNGNDILSLPNTPARRSSILRALDETFGTVSAGVSFARGLLSRSASEDKPIVKTEPVIDVITMKRSSDVTSPNAKREYVEPTIPAREESLPVAKKLEAPKIPFGLNNRDNAPHEPKPSGVQDSAEDTRTRLKGIQTQISHLQVILSNAERKMNKSRADITRIVRLRKEMHDLKGQKDMYNAALPFVNGPLSRGASLSGHPRSGVASTSAVQLPPTFFGRQVTPANATATFGPLPAPCINSARPHSLPPVKMETAHSVASGSNAQLTATAVKTDMDESGNPAFDFGATNGTAVPMEYDHLQDDRRFDTDGDFYGRGKDLFVGPVAKADDIDKFLISAGNSESFDGNASLDKALLKLGLKDLYQPLPGMEVALMPHQAIGVSWMIEKENSSSKGGCLADEMGLGKTVQMIALIATNRSQNPLGKSNLIVAPVALLEQWQQEIELKTNLGLSCIIYHGYNKPKRLEDIRRYDVVLTTFQTLANEWPDDEEVERREKRQKKRKARTSNGFVVTDDSEDDTSPLKKKARRSLLNGALRPKWVCCFRWRYRVCLDEAQNIRNKRTRISRAVTALSAIYRWCLTGTPIINGLQDAYGFIRFLRVRPWYDWKPFNEHIVLREKKQPDLATRRLQAIFASILLRRKKNSLLDGQRLIELPIKEVVLVKLQFTPEEREIYKMVEERSQAIFNKFLRAGTVLKNYTQVLVLLLRLRQVCSHPCLIQEGGFAFAEPAELADTDDREPELTRARQLVSLDFVHRMREKFKQVAAERMAAEQKSADATLEDEECPICFDNYTDAVLTPCGHIFCRECILNVLNGAHPQEGNGGTAYQADERPCPACRGAISKDRIFSRAAFEPTDTELNGTMDGSSHADEDYEMADVEAAAQTNPKVNTPRRPKRRASRKVVHVSPDYGDDKDMSDFIMQSDEDEEEKDRRRRARISLGKQKEKAIVISDDSESDDDIVYGAKRGCIAARQQVQPMPRFLPSTKMKCMMESLRTWARDHPNEKVLIISQWTQCLQLVSDYLTENKFPHVKYQGDMTRRKRDQAVRVFMAKDNATIMLMSLKCGGVGLNLTRANRVISLDLGWSEAVEAQAFDRVHRLGQNLPVVVQRLVISNTVEDRVLALQQRKQNLADHSLGEGNGKKLGKLTVQQLASLFGLDHRGRLLTT